MGGPSELVIRDMDGDLIGRMRVEGRNAFAADWDMGTSLSRREGASL